MNKKKVIYIILIIVTFLTSIFSSKLYFDKIEQKKFNNELIELSKKMEAKMKEEQNVTKENTENR